MNKPLVIYHASCADGFGAAFAAWLKLGDEAEYVAKRYGDGLEEVFSHPPREVYVVDFSFPKEVMDDLFAHATRGVWLDHHKTSRLYAEEKCGGSIGDRAERHNKALDIIHDNDKSGAMLAWEYFHPDTEVPMLIKHIDDYDRWQFKLDGTKEFNKALWSYAPWTFEQWHSWTFQLDHNLDGPYLSNHITAPFIKEGAAILRAHDQNVESVVKGAARACKLLHIKEQDASWYATHEHWEAEFDVNAVGLAANCPPHLTSDVGHELANQSGTFGLCWTLNKDKPVANCSLRSNGDYDVSAIAKAFGGGGHRNAAGFEVPIETLLRWLK